MRRTGMDVHLKLSRQQLDVVLMAVNTFQHLNQSSKDNRVTEGMTVGNLPHRRNTNLVRSHCVDGHYVETVPFGAKSL